MGNISIILDNSEGGNLCYRLSKTAVNQLTKTLAVDLATMGYKISALAIHPGYLATKMNDFYGEDDMEESMNSLVKTIETFGMAEDKKIPNGGYVDRNGNVLAL